MLSFTLKTEWYEKFKSGEKTVEYREVKPYWTKRIEKYSYWYSQFITPKEREFWMKEYPRTFTKEAAICILRLGYTGKYMKACISKIEIVDGLQSDLKIGKMVYAIHLYDIQTEQVKNLKVEK